MDNESRGLKFLLDTAAEVEDIVLPPGNAAKYEPTLSSQVGMSGMAADTKRAPAYKFAGFTYAQLLVGAVCLAAVIWAMWASARIFALEERRVVSVRLASIVNDFVAAEARSGTPPEELETQTREFMTALDTVLKKRADAGQVVLVGEAVIASSVPDVTNDVVSDLSRLVKMPVAVSMPPALAPSGPLSPLALQPAPATRAQDPSLGDGSSPFEQPSPPAQIVPQQ